jgi:hypothetical protein
MAVEKSKVIARLKALFPKANLSQKRLDALADKLASKPADDADDAAIDVVINDFNSVLSIEDIAREDDRVRTLEADKKKAEETAKAAGASKKEEEEEVIEVDNDAPAWAKALLKQNEKLTSDLEALKTGKTIETKKATASELFAKSEILKRIPESIRPNWINRIDVNSETPFEEQIQALEGEYSELVQVSADKNQYAPPAGGGSAEIKVDASIVDNVVNI